MVYGTQYLWEIVPEKRRISRDKVFLTFAEAANKPTTTLLCYAEISYLFSLANDRLDGVACRMTMQKWPSDPQ